MIWADVPYQIVKASPVTAPTLTDAIYRIASLLWMGLLLPMFLVSGKSKWGFWVLFALCGLYLYLGYDPTRD